MKTIRWRMAWETNSLIQIYAHKIVLKWLRICFKIWSTELNHKVPLTWGRANTVEWTNCQWRRLILVERTISEFKWAIVNINILQMKKVLPLNFKMNLIQWLIYLKSDNKVNNNQNLKEMPIYHLESRLWRPIFKSPEIIKDNITLSS